MTTKVLCQSPTFLQILLSTGTLPSSHALCTSNCGGGGWDGVASTVEPELEDEEQDVDELEELEELEDERFRRDDRHAAFDCNCSASRPLCNRSLICQSLCSAAEESFEKRMLPEKTCTAPQWDTCPASILCK